MKRELINKIVVGTIISTTLFTLAPTVASAAWVNDYQGNYYFMQDGKKVTGWKKIDGSLYYFDSYGRMQKGWIQAGDSWYFLQDDGSLKTGWIKYNKNYYYADSTGAIQTGVINIDGRVYIFDDKGIMKTSNTIINGVFYTIGSDGQVAGYRAPTPDKEFDSAGNLVQVLNSSSKTVSSPTKSEYNEVVQDKTQADYEDAKEGRKFTLTYKDSKTDGIIKTEMVKYGKKADLFAPTKTSYKFKEWNTRKDGSGTDYDGNDDIKIKGDTVLYAQWNDDTTVYVTGITISGSSYVTVGKTSQMTAQVSPSNAATSAVKWTVTNGTGSATIDQNTGVLTGVTAGTVTVKATATDGSGVSETKDVTVSATDVVVNVGKILVTTKTGGTPVITSNGGTLDLVASILPNDATTQDVTWDVQNGTGSATVSSISGNNITIKAISNGTITVKATAKDGSGIVGSATVTITGQTTVIPVDSVNIGTANATDTMAISKNDGTLQLAANILPATASNKEVTWSIIKAKNEDGVEVTAAADIAKVATISRNGVVSAIGNGSITVQVVTADGNKIATQDITITGQIVKIATIDITGPNAASGTNPVQMIAVITGENSKVITTGAAVKWTVTNGTGSASINPTTGLLTPTSDGTVTVKAAATDGSTASDTQGVTITGTGKQIPISNINVATATGATHAYVSEDNGTVDFIANITPTYATTTASAVTWSIVGGSDGGSAIIDPAGTSGNTVRIQAVKNGTVTVNATVTDVDGKTKTGSATVSIYNQIQEIESIAINAPANGGKVGVNEGLLLTATVTGGDAKYQQVKWQVSNGVGDTGSASFDSNVNGLLIGNKTGTVTVTAISTDGKGLNSTPIKITVVDPPTKTNNVTIVLPKDKNGADISAITTNQGSLSLSATVDAAATSNVVKWSVENVTGKATFVDNGDSTVTLTAVENGTINVTATANGGKTAVMPITISGQDATGLTVTSVTGAAGINKIGDTLDMTYNLVPSTATTPSAITWSVSDTTKASITTSADKKTATITAKDNGAVAVTVTATTANGVTLTNSKTISINAPKSIAITNGTASVNGGSITINNGSSLTLSAAVLPAGVTDGSVTWLVSDPSKVSKTESADTKTALFTGTASGTVLVTVQSNGDSNVKATTTIIVQ
ncbi:Ig-like domain-containing protein [Clostridium saccharoperbutylacetonicum]